MNKDLLSSHHIVPKSRKGKTTKANMATVTKRDHQLYHSLFDNKTPEEVIDYLSNYFWLSMEGQNGDRFIDNYLEK